MDQPLVEQLTLGAASPDVAIARRAILLLEGHAPHLESAEIVRVIEAIRPEVEPDLRGLVQRLRRDLPYHLGRTPSRSSLLAQATLPPAVARTLADQGITAGLDEARDLLEPLVDQVLDGLENERVENPARAWTTLRVLGHRGLVRRVVQAHRSGRSSPEQVRAMLGIEDEQARLFLTDLVKTRTLYRTIALEGLWILGSDSLSTLEEASGSEQRLERQAAVRALSRLRDPGALPLLLRHTGDPDSEVACQALTGLALLAGPGDALRIVALDPDLTDRRARVRWVHLMAIRGTPPELDKLRELLQDSDTMVRGDAALGLSSYVDETHKVRSKLHRIMDEDQSHARSGAIIGLFPHDTTLVEEFLASRLGSGNRRERIAGAECMRFIQTPALIQRLLAVHGSESDYEVGEAQRAALLHLDPRTPLATIEPLLTHPSASVRQTGVKLVEASLEKGARGRLEKLMSVEIDFTVRQLGTRALLRLVKREAPDQLRSLLSGKEPRVIASVVEDMGDLPAAEVVPPLLPMLGHPSNRVRAAAIISLFRQGRFDGIEHLDQLLEDPGGPGFSAGLYALRQLGLSLWGPHFIRYPGLMIALSDRAADHRGAEAPDRLLIDLGEFPSQTNIPLTGRRRTGRRAAHPQVIDLTAADTTRRQDASPETELEALLPSLQKPGPEGEEALRNHLARHPKHHAARYLLLKHLLQGGVDTGDLIGEFMGRSASPFLNPYLEIGRALKEIGKVPQAFGFYLKAFESKLLTIQNLMSVTKKSLDRGRLGDVNRALEMLGSLLPVDPGLHPSMGELFLSLKEYELSYQEFYRAHLAFPDNAVISLKLAAIAAKTKRRALALQVLDGLIRSEDETSEIGERARRLRERLTR